MDSQNILPVSPLLIWRCSQHPGLPTSQCSTSRPRSPHPLELRGPTSFHRLPSPHTSSGGQSCGHGFEVCCLSLGLSKPLRPKFHLGQPQWLERDRRVQGRVDQAFFFFFSQLHKTRVLIYILIVSNALSFCFVLRSRTDQRLYLNSPFSSAGGECKDKPCSRGAKIQDPMSVTSKGQES